MRISLEKRFDGTPAQNAHRVVAAVFGVLALVCLMGAAILWAIERGISAEARLLAAEGQEAVAEVLDRRIIETRSTDSDGRTTTSRTYYLRLAFTTAAGDRVEIEPSVGQARYEATPQGTRLTLRYAPSNPAVIEFEAGGREAEAGVLRLVWQGLALLVVVFTGLALWKLRRPVNVV